MAGAVKGVRYHLQFQAVAPESLCAAGTLAVPYLLYRLFTCSSSSSLFSAGTFQRQRTTSTRLPAPPLLSAVVLSPHGLLGVLPCHLALAGRSIYLPSSAWFPLHDFPHTVDSYFPSLSRVLHFYVQDSQGSYTPCSRVWFLCFICSALGLH